MESLVRRPVFGATVLLLVGVLLLAGTTRVQAQGEEGQRGKRLVTLTKMPKVSKGKAGGWLVDVEAKAPDVPAGVKIRFLLTWRSQTIESYTVKLDTSKRMKESFKVAAAPVSTHKMLFRTEIHAEDQSRSLKKTLEQDVETFPPGLDPWTDYHLEQQFLMGTPEEIEAELVVVRAFFQERYIQLAGLDRRVRDEAKKAVAREAYVQGEALDTSKWRKLMDKEILPPIAKIQKEITESFTSSRFIPYRGALMDLQEISRGIASRVTSKSIEVYREFEAGPNPADKKPEGINAKPRGRPPIKGSYLSKRVSRINKALGIVPPKKEVTPDPQKPKGTKGS